MDSFKVEKIYFDMDGVLANFDLGVKEICGMEAPDQNSKHKNPEYDDEMWKRVKQAGHFYDYLELLPGARKLFDYVYNRYGDRCEILSGIPKPRRGIDTAGEDKINWVRRLLSKDIKVNIVFREEKPNYCKGIGCVLIDDYTKNIREWEEMGGTGVLNENAAKTLEKLKEMGI